MPRPSKKKRGRATPAKSAPRAKSTRTVRRSKAKRLVPAAASGRPGRRPTKQPVAVTRIRALVTPTPVSVDTAVRVRRGQLAAPSPRTALERRIAAIEELLRTKRRRLTKDTVDAILGMLVQV